jgi:hypothetical protein
VNGLEAGAVALASNRTQLPSKYKNKLLESHHKKITRGRGIADKFSKAGFVGDRIGNVVTVIKVKEAVDKARQEGKSVLQSAQDIQGSMIDAVMDSLKKKLITAAEAEKRIVEINKTFEEAIAGAWKVELIDNGVAALEAVKSLAVDWANNLVGGSGDAADAVFSKIGEWGWFVDED